MNNTHCSVEHCVILIPTGYNNQTINQEDDGSEIS